MNERTHSDQLVKYLADAHSIEAQALVQMQIAPRMAGGRELARAYDEHRRETEEHERLVAGRLRELGADPSRLKDFAGRAGGWGMALFARVNPDTPGKLIAHAYAYEHMELAAYELLRRAAEKAGDSGTADLARLIGEQERAMADRLAGLWDAAVDASLATKQADDLGREVVKYLRDAHAIEGQAVQLLEAGPVLTDVPELTEAFQDHLAETREQQGMVDERLSALGSRPARFQAAGLRAGALSLGTFFTAQPDTTVKLAGFAYAFEALEVAGYELLARTAARAGDEETRRMAETIRAQEQAAAERIAATWDGAMERALADLVAS